MYGQNRKIRKVPVFSLALFFALWFLCPVFGHAAQGYGGPETGSFVPDYTEIQQFLDQQDTGLSFSGMVEEMTSGGWSRIPQVLLAQAGQD